MRGNSGGWDRISGTLLMCVHFYLVLLSISGVFLVVASNLFVDHDFVFRSESFMTLYWYFNFINALSFLKLFQFKL